MNDNGSKDIVLDILDISLSRPTIWSVRLAGSIRLRKHPRPPPPILELRGLWGHAPIHVGRIPNCRTSGAMVENSPL